MAQTARNPAGFVLALQRATGRNLLEDVLGNNLPEEIRARFLQFVDFRRHSPVKTALEPLAAPAILGGEATSCSTAFD
jgi:hypothetical protein